MITEDQYNKLKKYDKPLRQAYYHNYFTQVTSKQIQEIHNIYKEATGDLTPVNYACGGCQLSLLQRVGKIYFTYKPTPTTIPVEETFTNDEDIEKKQTIWDRMAKARAAKKNKK